MNKLTLGTRKAAASDAGFQRMETCTCLVSLGGDIRNQVPRYRVSVPELILLRAIHGGAETVVNVQRDGESRENAASERMRLLKLYPRQSQLFAELFPGLSPEFPKTLAEAEEIAAQEMAVAEDEAVGATPEPPLAAAEPNPVDS